MGRAARAKAAKAKPVKLSREDFYHLSAKLAELKAAQSQARERAQQLAIQIVQKEIAGVHGQVKTVVETLSKKYGFPTAGTFALNEAKLTVTVEGGA